ncbi:flavin reductase family protein [Roseateles amylovorans]|uniref:Flavin reductase family protein n=1 Tax=Roseateles amylovorans TaxID=2978473 RepID=A0ABY6B446_9BURK|nr:flavin reductase family protein [Roseateles amylovorans]UXH79960.1 flavin reductase family protein [Roseateles amylovorans]
MRQAVPLAKASRLLNHGPTVLVASAHQGQRDVMAAAWNMPLDFDPPKVAVVIDKNTFSRGLIEASGSFVLSVPSAAQVDLVTGVGHTSGRDLDKFSRFGLSTEPASLVEAPLVQGCLAWLECRIYPEPYNQARYDLFLAEVVAAWADDTAFREGHWLDLPEGRRALHHLGGGQYFTTSGLLVGRMPDCTPD